jgi:hypothetical protein
LEADGSGGWVVENRPERAGWIRELRWGKFWLVAKENRRVLMQNVLDLLNQTGIQMTQIHSGDFGAEKGRQW